MTKFYDNRGLRVTRLVLPGAVTVLLAKRELPQSLTALSCTPWPVNEDGELLGESDTLFGAASYEWDVEDSPGLPVPCDRRSDERYRWLLSQERLFGPLESRSHHYGTLCPLDYLPTGLQFLQYSPNYNSYAKDWSSRLTRLHHLEMNRSFNCELYDWLPPSLVHLSLGNAFNQRIQVDDLPAGLQRLHLGGAFSQPLPPEVLPPSLKVVEMDYECNSSPLTLRSTSITHLLLKSSLQLTVDTFPSSLISLDLPYTNEELLPNVLPHTLHELILSGFFSFPLHPNSLPAGLKFLRFLPEIIDDETNEDPYVHPLTLNQGLVALDLQRSCSHPIGPGSIPASVRWLRLSPYYLDKVEGMQLPASTEVIWGDGPSRL